MWKAKEYEQALKASNELLKLASDLNDALGAGEGATPPNAVLNTLRGITE